MLLVLSPAKSLDFESPVRTRKNSQPAFLPESQQLIETLRDYSPEDISELMNISARLGELNFKRFLDWQQPFDNDNARQAIFAFTGDVYTGLDVSSLNDADLEFAQRHLRILSGLYGMLRPLDLMQPYRLEMGTSLKHGHSTNLYEFWGDKLTEAANQQLQAQNSSVLVNLASNEYFKAVKVKDLQADVISPVFRDYKNGQYKIISFHAKKARGMMAAWVIRNRLDHPEQLKEFKVANYCYSEEESSPDKPVFLRRQE